MMGGELGSGPYLPILFKYPKIKDNFMVQIVSSQVGVISNVKQTGKKEDTD